MLNKTLCLIILCTIVHTIPSFGQVKLKRIFQDNTYNNRTNVIKETGENDYSILDEQFGDAKVGEVVRIAIEKPKPQKPPKPPKPPKPVVVKTKPIKEVERLPNVKVEKEVFRAKGNSDTNVYKPKKAVAPKRTQFSASPSEYGAHKTYQAQLPKVKLWKKKKRKVRKRKSCYFFN